jgi:hypothetical protein
VVRAARVNGDGERLADERQLAVISDLVARVDHLPVSLRVRRAADRFRSPPRFTL